MNTKYGKLISRDRQGNLTAVYPEILCDDEVNFESRTSTYPVTNIGVANAIDNGVSRANTSIKNAFTSPTGGLGWDDTAKKGYVDFSGMSATKLKNLINVFLKNNSAVIADSNGKLDVDFSKLTADEVLALFLANSGVVKDSSGKLKIDFSKMTADQVLALFLANSGIIKDSSSGKLKVDFSKLTADQVLALFLANSGVVKDSSGKLKIDFSKLTVNDILALSSTTGGLVASSESGTNNGKIAVDFSKAPSYSGATASKAGTPGYVPSAQTSERNKFLKGDGTWQEISEMSAADKTKLDGLSQYPRLKYLGFNFAPSTSGTVNSTNAQLQLTPLSTSVGSIFMMTAYKGLSITSEQPSETSTYYNGCQYNKYNLVVDGARLAGDGLIGSAGVLSVPEYEGATTSAAATAGLVPPALSSERDKFLKGDGTWSDGGFAHLTGTETFTGSKTFGAGLFGKTVAVSASSINLSLGTVFTKTISAATTFTFTGVPSGAASTFNLILTNGGSKTITWPSNVKWTDGTPPSLSAPGVDVLTFLTPNGGTTWYGCLALNGAA